jgi:probable addiction module antidote protein
VSRISKSAGITRSGLYEALSGKRNPSFTTVIRLLDAMGLQLKVITNH